MSKHNPAVPPANRSDKGPGDPKRGNPGAKPAAKQPPQNLKEQGRQGDINQNTTHQGFQQDR